MNIQRFTLLTMLIIAISGCGGSSDTPTSEDDNNANPPTNETEVPETTPTVTVNLADVKQSITMMGGDMERSHKNFDKVANPKEVIQWLAGDINFDTWRVSYDKHQEETEGVKNFAIYDDAVLAMQMIKAVNPQIKFFATLESDYNGYSQGNRNNLPTFIYDYAYDKDDGTTSGTKSFDAVKYGMFLADYVEYMAQSGVALTYLATSKEYIGVITPARSKVTMETLFDELTRRDVAIPKIIDAGTWSLTAGIRLIDEYQDLDINQNVVGYSSHNYWSQENKTWRNFITAANNAGKMAFNEESGHGGGGPILDEVEFSRTIGTYVAKAEMYDSGLQGEAIFELWPRGVAEIQTNKYFAKPVFFNNGTDGRRMRSYYIMQKFANHAVNSTYVDSTVQTDTGLAPMAFLQDGRLALWLMNPTDTEIVNAQLAITEFGLKAGMSVEHSYWVESTAIEGAVQNLRVTDDHELTVTIEPQSINLFVFSQNYAVTPQVKTNNANWLAQDYMLANEGDTVEFEPQTDAPGSWSWVGPNNFTAEQALIQLSSVNMSHAGNYTATFTDEFGHSTTMINRLDVNCSAAPETFPVYKLNHDDSISNQTAVPVTAGDKLTFAPETTEDGTWLWSGPKGFARTGQSVEIENVKPDMAGKYIGAFTSNQGCTTKIEFDVSVHCSVSPTIVPKMQIAGKWSQTNTLDIREGDAYQIGPTSPDIGRWHWTGPNNFKAMEVRQLSFQNATSSHAGQYTATLTTPKGCSTSETFNLTFVEGGCTPASITPYLRVDEAAWLQTNQASLNVGSVLDIGPQPHGGTWSWSGPDGFTSNERQIKIENIQASQTGTYTAIYTPANGCPGRVEFIISVND